MHSSLHTRVAIFQKHGVTATFIMAKKLIYKGVKKETIDYISSGDIKTRTLAQNSGISMVTYHTCSSGRNSRALQSWNQKRNKEDDKFKAQFYYQQNT